MKIKNFENFNKTPILENASAGLLFHVNNDIPLSENIYRMGSDAYFELWREARNLRESLILNDDDKWFLDSDIGESAQYNGETIWLDTPMLEAEYHGKEVSLNKPKRGGSKKFYVYTKKKDGTVIKVSFGASGGGGNLAVKLQDPCS